MPETSKYEAGDYVVYRYSGSYRPEPVILTEQVLSKNGNKLEILVEWSSGKEARAWKQFVTDTPFNRKNNTVDRLVLLDGGKETELPNEGNADLFKLYEGTFLIPQRPPHHVKERRERLKIGGTEYLCDVKEYDTKVLNKRAVMKSAECADFLWTHAGAEYRDLKGELIYGAEVLEHGRKK
ncbi:MAG: hypothetical protein A3J79_00815 [Elusimicrobia bacterium RIFOXYB2_FULL_62_6]|nr:MAG: hypothetical protein A3J79_00815 [Elusimicrobia bacterium RIFOXYB2_FULL_62_6]